MNNRRREGRRPWASRHFFWKCPGPAGAAPTNSNRVSRLKHPKPSEDNNRTKNKKRNPGNHNLHRGTLGRREDLFLTSGNSQFILSSPQIINLN